MSEQSNIELIQRAYAAFGRGDVPGVLDTMSQDVDWDIPGPASIPTIGRRRGLSAVGEFFQTLGETQTVESFEPRKYFASGDMVVVLGHYRWTVRSTGRPVECDWVHAFTITNGKVSSFKEITDTAAFLEAYGVGATAAL